MYQKDYSKNGQSKEETGKTTNKASVFYMVWYAKFKAFTLKKPKLAIISMLIFATVNFFVMLYVVNSRPAKSLIPKDLAKTINRTENKQTASYSIANYIKISKLKDSLDYLMRVPKLTKTDSLLFIRICDEYAKLDPSFSQSLKQALTKKSPIYEKDNH